MSDLEQTRPTLLLRLRNGRDDGAWSQFVDLYSPLIYRYLRGCGLQDADAADVMQEVLRSVEHGIHQFSCDGPGRSFRGWLITVTRSRLRDHTNKQKRQVAGSGDTNVLSMLDAVPTNGEFEQRWEQQYQHHLFHWGVERIRDEFQAQTWQAFWQTAIEQKEMKGVAESLGMSVGALYVARNRVIKRLRQIISDEIGEQL